MSNAETAANAKECGFFVANFGVPLVLSSLEITTAILLKKVQTAGTLEPELAKAIALVRNAERINFGLQVAYWLCVALTAGLLHLITFILMQVSLRSSDGQLFSLKQTLAKILALPVKSNSSPQPAPTPAAVPEIPVVVPPAVVSAKPSLADLCEALFEDFPPGGVECRIKRYGPPAVAKTPCEFLELLMAQPRYDEKSLLADTSKNAELLPDEKDGSVESFINKFVFGNGSASGITIACVFHEFAQYKKPEEIFKVKEGALNQVLSWKQLIAELRRLSLVGKVNLEIIDYAKKVDNYIRSKLTGDVKNLKGVSRAIIDNCHSKLAPVGKIYTRIETSLKDATDGSGQSDAWDCELVHIFDSLRPDSGKILCANGVDYFEFVTSGIPLSFREIAVGDFGTTLTDLGKFFGFMPATGRENDPIHNCFSGEMLEEFAAAVNSAIQEFMHAANLTEIEIGDQPYTFKGFVLEMLAGNYANDHPDTSLEDARKRITSLISERTALLNAA
jgi:hypothetical protein